MTLTHLPDELLLAILTEAVYVRSVKRALRLRLVSRRFQNIATTAIYQSRILDTAVNEHTDRAPEFWIEYLVHLTLAHNCRKSSALETLLGTAEYICRYRRINANGTEITTRSIANDELRGCVTELCRTLFMPPIIPTGCEYVIRIMVTLPENDNEIRSGINIVTPDANETALQFNQDLLSAAAWLGEVRLAAKLLEEGYNSHKSMFGRPVEVASYRGHAEIVKLILADDLIRRPYKPANSHMIARYGVDHVEILDIALDLVLRETFSQEAQEVQDRRAFAMSYVRSPEIFKRLLEQSKPHDPRYKTYSDRYSSDRLSSVEPREYSWFSLRVEDAVKRGETDLLRYFIQEDRVEDIDEGYLNDGSMFKSRHPLVFAKLSKKPDRAATLLSQASRNGDWEAVKILLDAGFKNDRAIGFAAMCGSRRIVRMLWEYGGHKHEAVQEALAIAVDREDTAMFNLLGELGAKFDADVREAVLQKSKHDRLDSMVELLQRMALESY